MTTFVRKNIFYISLISLGIGLRLIVSFLFNHNYDFINILALVKSVAETGSLAPGLTVLQRSWPHLQIYGKIYYQIPAIWLHVLNSIHLLDIQYLLDNKPFQNIESYLGGINAWGPPLFQLTAIKLIQFIWDFLLLFSLYQILCEFNISGKWRIIFFWAINPFIMLIGYVIFMSDLAMTATLTATLLFWIKSLKEKQNYRRHIYAILSILFIALGSVIKQVPLLFLPFLLLSLYNNVRQTAAYTFTFVLSYFFISQSWAADGELIKQFFLLSKESLAIFDATINGIPIFLFSYLTLFVTVWIYRHTIFSKLENILYIAAGLILIIYFSAMNVLLFVQFYLWIIPISALIAMIQPRLRIIFIFSSLLMLLKIIEASDYMTTLMSPTIGAGFADYIQYRAILKNYINPLLIDKTIMTIQASIFVGMIWILLSTLFNKSNALLAAMEPYLKISFTKICISIFCLYCICVFIDYPIKAKYIILPQPEYQIQNTENLLTQKPIHITIDNSAGHTITTVDLFIKKTKYETLDSVLLTFSKNKKTFYQQEIPDFMLPTDTENPYIIFLDKPIQEKQFTLSIAKKKGLNQVIIPDAKILPQQLNKPKNSRFNGYDGFIDKEIITASFSNPIVPVSFRGNYKLWYIARALRFHILQKPSFYTFYFFSIILFISFGIYGFYKKREIFNKYYS